MSAEHLLEQYFRKAVLDAPQELAASFDYVSAYFNIVAQLTSKVYPAIDVALANMGGIFTYHNKDHFDEVIRKTEKLIGLRGSRLPGSEEERFHAYEVFVLLVAIRIHDVGNCFGRDEHEKRCFDVLMDICGNALPFRESEIGLIAEIAQAHGGENPDGSKDVIGVLPFREHIGGADVRAQRIAATVRLADELAENTMRTPIFLLEHSLIPKKNEVFHEYAKSVQSNNVERMERGCTVHLRYSISVDDAKKMFGKGDREVLLLDEIRERLTKMNRERIYCNRFLDPGDRLESIDAQIVIRKPGRREVVWKNEFLIRDEGYPGNYECSVLACLRGEEIVRTL